MTARECKKGNCHPRNHCRPRRNRGLHWFYRSDNFPCYTLVQSIIIILYWMFIKEIVYITYGFKTIQVKWIILFVLPYIQTLRQRQSESMVNCAPIKSAQSIFFYNITCRQAISLVAKSHHVLGRGFLINPVVLLFINVSQLLYMKVYIVIMTMEGYTSQRGPLVY